jgi:large subunit ribosomal protein L10
LPTQKKIDTVEELRDRISRATIAIGADFTGLRVAEMNALRRTMRAANVEVRVIKNNLLKLAADQAEIPELMGIIEGPTALVLGYEEITEAAKALDDYTRTAPPTFAIRGAYLDGQVVSPEDLKSLVRLPPKPVLLAQIAGQLQSPMASLLALLDAPLIELTSLLQSLLGELPGLVEARAKQLEERSEPPGGSAPDVSDPAAAPEAATPEAAADESPSEASAEEAPPAEAPAEEPAAEDPAAGEAASDEGGDQPPAEEETPSQPTEEIESEPEKEE